MADTLAGNLSSGLTFDVTISTNFLAFLFFQFQFQFDLTYILYIQVSWLNSENETTGCGYRIKYLPKVTEEKKHVKVRKCQLKISTSESWLRRERYIQC